MKLSVWGGSVDLGIDFESLCQAVLDDLSSDLFVFESIQTTGIQTVMPDDCVVISSVKLAIGFQGNRFVKYTYDRHTKVCNVRYVPAIITYKRHLRLDDLGDKVRGARLKYLKAAILEKMASVELSYLTTVHLESDAGSINLEALSNFKNEQHSIVESLHEDVTLYSNG